MHDTNEAIAALGNEPPLTADGRSGPPDRREVSARWLSGTFLTGLTSSVLMGVALFAALDGREGEWWAPLRTGALRTAAAAALREVGTPEAVAALTDASEHGSRGVRAAARHQLARGVPAARTRRQERA